MRRSLSLLGAGDKVIFMAGRTRIVIEKDDPAECGCDDAYRVVEKDARDRIVRVHGKAIKSYAVAQNVADIARGT